MQTRSGRRGRHHRSSRRRARLHTVTGAKLGHAVLGYLVLVVAVVTLAPFRFRVPGAVYLTYWTGDSRWYGAFDPIANVALFAPLGFVYALTRATAVGKARGTLVRALLGGLMLSLMIETAQLFEPARYASPVDVVTNASGALLGAWLHTRLAWQLRADALLGGGLALELPVMGLVYVALPLVTLAALTVNGGVADAGAFAARPAGLIALALFGAALLGTVQRRRRSASDEVPADARRAMNAAGSAALWFGLGALPALALDPDTFGVGLATAMLGAALVSSSLLSSRRDERRFEGEAIGRAAPFLVLSLALFPFGQQDASAALTDGQILRALEGLCGFAVLGYLLGEAWGRRELRYRHSVWRVGGAAALAAVSQALLARGSETPLVPALVDVVARTLCAAYGGWIYHLQRAHVRALVEARQVHGTVARRRPWEVAVTRLRGATPVEVHAPRPMP